MMVKKTDQGLDVFLCTFHYSWSSEAHFSVLVWSKNVTSIGINNLGTIQLNLQVKVARYSFSGSIPPKFKRKLRRHKQSFGKTATTVVLDKDENLL